MFTQRRPDPAASRRELQRNLQLFLVAVAAIRAAPYVLEALRK